MLVAMGMNEFMSSLTSMCSKRWYKNLIIKWGRLNRHIIALIYFIWKIFLLIFTFFIIMVYVYLDEGWRCWPCFQTERQCWHFTQQRHFFRFIAANFFSFFAAIFAKKKETHSCVAALNRRKHPLYPPVRAPLTVMRRRQVAISRHHQAVSGSGEDLRRTRLHITVKDAIIISQALETTRNLQLTSTSRTRLMTLGKCRELLGNGCLHSGQISLVVAKQTHSLEDCDFSPLRQGGCVCAVKRVICSSLPVIGVCV